MARTKYTAKKRTVDNSRLAQAGKVVKLREKVPKKPLGEKMPVLSEAGGVKQKSLHFQPGTKALL